MLQCRDHKSKIKGVRLLFTWNAGTIRQTCCISFCQRHVFNHVQVEHNITTPLWHHFSTNWTEYRISIYFITSIIQRPCCDTNVCFHYQFTMYHPGKDILTDKSQRPGNEHIGIWIVSRKSEQGTKSCYSQLIKTFEYRRSWEWRRARQMSTTGWKYVLMLYKFTT